MSNSETIKYTCPYWRKEFDVEIYNTVNVSQDPDLKERCMSGDIFLDILVHIVIVIWRFKILCCMKIRSIVLLSGYPRRN